MNLWLRMPGKPCSEDDIRMKGRVQPGAEEASESSRLTERRVQRPELLQHSVSGESEGD